MLFREIIFHKYQKKQEKKSKKKKSDCFWEFEK